MRYTKAEAAPFVSSPTYDGALQRYQAKRRQARNVDAIADHIEDTFGPNPCQRLTLQDQETGEQIHKVCNTKRCEDCGPRKLATMEMQLRTLGETIWVANVKDKAELNRHLERVKKQHQRNGLEYTYQIVGDDYLGWIITSDVQILPQQSKGLLAQWKDRIRHAYQYGLRIRRSRALGTMSLVRHRTVDKQGTSPWKYLSGAPDLMAHATSWAQELKRITKKRQESEEEWELEQMLRQGPSLRVFSEGLPCPMCVSTPCMCGQSSRA